MTQVKGAIIGFIVLFLSQFSVCFAQEKIKLDADHIFYRENGRVMIASDNVHLTYGDINITAHRLYLDVDTNMAWSQGNVVIKRGEDEFQSGYLLLDLDKEEVTLKDIQLSIMPPEKKALIYLKAKELIDKGDVKIGKSGYATTCDDPDHHHHFAWAQKFVYYPDKKIVLYNAIFYNKFLGIPILIPTPYYRYNLGKRRLVWNFPIIGKKERDGWGWFVQNTLDYGRVNGRDSSILLDWFENKGLGTGIRHQFDKNNQDGSIYYYRFNFDEKNEKLFNQQFEFKNTSTLSDTLSISQEISNTDVAERINSTGSDHRDKKKITLQYDDLGNAYSAHFDEYNNFTHKNKSFSTGFSHRVNSQKNYHINFSTYDNFNNHDLKKRTLSDGVYYLNLPKEMRIETQYSYSNAHKKSLRNRDQNLTNKIKLIKTFNSQLSMDIEIDQLFDLDEDTVTQDRTYNDYLYKLPEINFKYNRDLGPFKFSQKSTIGRYQESKYISNLDFRRIYPISHDFGGLKPNTYIFDQTLDKTYSGLPLKGTYTIGTGYQQYVFKTPEKGLFEGDALYAIDFHTSYANQPLPFLKTKTSYNSSYSPKENNSPFFAFDKSTRELNEISEKLTFFYKSENKYRWENRLGYNWVTEKWTTLYTNLKIKPINSIDFYAQTGKNVNQPGPSDDIASPFEPLEFKTTLIPRKKINIKHYISLDINPTKTHDVRSSYVRLQYNFGKNLYDWNIAAYFRYNTNNQSTKYVLKRYEMQTISIKKHEHRRTVEIGYTKNRQEVTFKYSLDAFPNDPLELRKTKNIWKLEGRFKKSSEERFK